MKMINYLALFYSILSVHQDVPPDIIIECSHLLESLVSQMAENCLDLNNEATGTCVPNECTAQSIAG